MLARLEREQARGLRPTESLRLDSLLLDTCALIWLASEPARLSQTATAAINAPEAALHDSHASLWEIALKHGAGKLMLPEAPRRWWTDQVGKWGLLELSLTAEALLRGSELPPHHKDPFDRVILAQALQHNLAVVSPTTLSRLTVCKYTWRHSSLRILGGPGSRLRPSGYDAANRHWRAEGLAKAAARAAVDAEVGPPSNRGKIWHRV